MSDGDKIITNQSRQGRALLFRAQLIYEGADGKICCLETNFKWGHQWDLQQTTHVECQSKRRNTIITRKKLSHQRTKAV